MKQTTTYLLQMPEQNFTEDLYLEFPFEKILTFSIDLNKYIYEHALGWDKMLTLDDFQTELIRIMFQDEDKIFWSTFFRDEVEKNLIEYGGYNIILQ